MIKKYTCLVFSFLGLFCSSVWAISAPERHPFYIGGIVGAGSTTWYGLVPTISNKNEAMSVATPLEVNEGGGVFGALLGYEFSPFFAIEANYLKYPSAYIIFDKFSIFALDHDGGNNFKSNTETIGVLGKIMVAVPKTHIRFYSGAGVGGLHRKDILNDGWLATPMFNVGFIAPVLDRVTADIAANYTAGYGESQLKPTETYFPFLYSVTLRLAYHF